MNKSLIQKPKYMKAIIILAFSLLLLSSCEEEIFKIDEPINGDVSFIINGQRYSSSLNWSISSLNNSNPLINTVSELIIIDTLGFNFSHILILNHADICGIVFTDDYKDPKYNAFHPSDENNSCYEPYWLGERDLEMETLAMFKIINGSFEMRQINCITKCGKDNIDGSNICRNFCDLEGIFSFEAINGYGDSILVSDGKYIAYSQPLY